LELALRESLSRGDNFIGSEHVLLGLLRAEEDAPIAALRRRGASPERVRDALLAELGG